MGDTESKQAKDEQPGKEQQPGYRQWDHCWRVLPKADVVDADVIVLATVEITVIDHYEQLCCT